MALIITRPTQPTTFPDGTGRNAVVRNGSGQHFLVSEVHRQLAPGHRVDMGTRRRRESLRTIGV